MSRQWRWYLVVVMAITLFGSFGSTGLPMAGPLAARVVVLLRQEEPQVPVGCQSAACSKGTSAPVSPPPLSVVLGAALVGVAAAVSLRTARRVRTLAHPLPRGTAAPLFHPPQFS
jgi:hypothetical protein